MKAFEYALFAFFTSISVLITGSIFTACGAESHADAPMLPHQCCIGSPPAAACGFGTDGHGSCRDSDRDGKKECQWGCMSPHTGFCEIIPSCDQPCDIAKDKKLQCMPFYRNDDNHAP